MKTILSEMELRALRAALWDDVKHLPAPRKVRKLFMEQLYLEWVERRRRKEEEREQQQSHDSDK